MAKRQGDATRATAVDPSSKRSGDRFDRLPASKRVGAHRFTARPRRFWYYFLAAVIAIALVTGAGVIAIQLIGSNVTNFLDPENPGSFVAQTGPELNPDASIAVLNGTEADALGFAVADEITTNEWGQIAFSEVAAQRDVEISAVFYESAADESMALGLAKELGGVSIYQNSDYTEYGVDLVVLLGTDYAGPGSEAAATTTE